MALPQEFVDLAREVNNWGRWGDDDQLGTLNLITAEVVHRAVGCVNRGKTFNLALPLSSDGPQTGALPGRINPVHLMTMVNSPLGEVASSDDAVAMGLQCATHWDALSHVSYRDVLYNGFPASSITADGASKCAIHEVKTLVSRGVLIDVARAKGVERLEPGYVVTGTDLDEATMVKPLPGDIVLVRTGHIQLLAEDNKRKYGYPSPGFGVDAVRWFHRHDVSAAANDTMTYEALPSEMADVFLPVHALDLVEMGLLQGQNFYLEELAADCASDGVYDFLLEATPEPFVAAVGAPVVPIAIK